MKKCVCLAVFAVFAAVQCFAVEIVPKPVSVVENGGAVQLSKSLTFNVGTPELESLVAVWGETFAPIVTVEEMKAKVRADVLLLIDEALEPEEYSLVVADAPNKVVITGGSVAGTWWGMQTLAQLLVQSAADEGFSLPCVSISDKPFFAYRSGMLDCSRHFFTVDEVKTFIDMLALHKLNTFHWHLTDDQGWRLEVRKYPLLTEVGSIRKETIVGLRATSRRRGIGQWRASTSLSSMLIACSSSIMRSSTMSMATCSFRMRSRKLTRFLRPPSAPWWTLSRQTAS